LGRELNREIGRGSLLAVVVRTSLILYFLLLLSLPAFGQREAVWKRCDRAGQSAVLSPDSEQVYGLVLRMVDRWNAHDLEGNLAGYWKSPELLVVVDAEQFVGWEQLHDSYVIGYLDRNLMGFIDPKSIQVRMLKPDVALVLTWWSEAFPGSEKRMVGTSTMDLEKFPDGWKVVAEHTSCE
jgi:hypothetical protein